MSQANSRPEHGAQRHDRALMSRCSADRATVLI